MPGPSRGEMQPPAGEGAGVLQRFLVEKGVGEKQESIWKEWVSFS